MGWVIPHDKVNTSIVSNVRKIKIILIFLNMSYLVYSTSNFIQEYCIF